MLKGVATTGQKEWNDLSAQQRAHLIHELDSEIAYQRLKSSAWLLQRLQQSADSSQALEYARAFALLRGAKEPAG